MNPSQVTVSVTLHPDGRPRGFQLTLGSETVPLEPGRGWSQTDRFKWVTRGLIEPPQSFAVHPDGSVDLNGEHYRPEEPDHAADLAKQINKHHLPPPTPASPTPATPEPSPSRPAESSPRVRFRVHLDARSHVMVEAFRGSERTETGLRGLAHLALDGWMIQPHSLHVDPLQRYLELDGTRFDSDPHGAQALEAALNQRYAPETSNAGNVAVEVRENPGASTGFDIHFWMLRAGTRFEIKGHLGQDKLDILQDHEKCGLLRPGVILRISPPFLYFRRRRADGGEEAVPDIPDVKYRAITAPELQRLLNHPSICAASNEAPAGDSTPAITPLAPAPSTHPEAQPLPHSDAIPPTPALVPPPAGHSAPPPSTATTTALSTPPESAPKRPSPPPSPPPPPPARPATAQPPADPVLAELFALTDPQRINVAIFRQLSERLHLAPQDVLLTLPRVFDDREFEILAFTPMEISSVLQLRSDAFYGFYLAHLGPDRSDLVYACHGTHIEWGTHKCALQPHANSETLELPGSALRGLAQNAQNHFVFLVEPKYRDFVRNHEKACAEAFAHFLTIAEWAEHRSDFPLLWPVPG